MRFGIMKRYAICIVASVIVSIGAVLGGSCGLAYAAIASDQLWVELPGGKEVYVQEVDENECLFLPSQVDTRKLSVVSSTGSLWLSDSQDGPLCPVVGSVDLAEFGLASADGRLISNESSIWVSTDGQSRQRIFLYQSQGIRSVFVNTQHDRSYVDSSPSHSAKDTGAFSVVNIDGSIAVDADMEFIRGRGNSTWIACDKKPYQVKLKKKADVLGTGEKSKTWLLLANAADPTLLRNTISFNLARYMGSLATPSCQPCDFYYNGEYRGSYLLTEKVKVEKYGVDISDLDDANESANEGSDAIENPWSYREHSLNDRGQEYSYVSGLNDPDNISGGYLIELDDKTASGELSMFNASSHSFIIHTPEIATNSEAKYISELFDIGFTAARNGGIDDASGKSVYDVFDIDSLIATGLTEDFIWDGDYLYSSSYFYTPQDDGKIYLGPIWDCDRTFGLRYANTCGVFAQTFLSGNSALLSELGQVEQTKLAPVVRQVLLGDASASTANGNLRSISYYAQEIAASQVMDQVLWGLAPLDDEWLAFDRVDGKSWEAYVSDLGSFAQQRIGYMDSFYAQSSWSYCTWVWDGVYGWTPYLDGTPCRNGWVDDKGTWYYMLDGRMQVGWCCVNGTWYYFDKSGAMCTGWLSDGGTWYYLRSSGAMVTGWVADGSSWYYMDGSGSMARGWRFIGSEWYYLGFSGAMSTGWNLVGGSWYLFSESGVMHSGWRFVGDSWYYLGQDGAMRTDWAYVDGSWYYLDGSGALVYGWRWVDGAWYYLTDTGAMAIGWQEDNGSWYYLSESGAMLTGWQFVGGAWYYLDPSSGAMRTGWSNVSGKWYMLSGSGAMQTGWIAYNGDWYWCASSGEMVTGLRSIGGQLYKFDASGRLVA